MPDWTLHSIDGRVSDKRLYTAPEPGKVMCINHSHKKTAQFILTTLLIAVFAFPALNYAQTATLTPRETLIQAIAAQAQQDVELERQGARALDLKTLIGEEARAASQGQFSARLSVQLPAQVASQLAGPLPAQVAS